MKKLIGILFIALFANQANGDANIKMPKYFFTDAINKACKMKQPAPNFFDPPARELDLTIAANFNWLEDLKHYSWVEDHALTSNSLNVHFLELTDRTEFITTVLTNSIIDGSIETQANKAIDLILTWSKADVIMDSTSVEEILAMRKKGTYSKCYKGAGEEEAVCHWHTAQEAARYAGNIAIIAILARPYMDNTELRNVEIYLNAMYHKYILPWYNYSGSGNPKMYPGYYQMGHGAVSMLAYANWHNDKKIAEYTFKTTFQNINYKIWDEEGFIDNNSFRGVRGYWYHSLALNNMLGMVALAEQYNYPVENKIYSKLASAVNFLNQDAKEYLHFLEGLDKYKNKHGNLYTNYKGRELYIGNASWKHENARHHIHQEAKYLEYLANKYTNASLPTERVEYKIYKSKTKKELSDTMLGFNPTCLTR